MISNPADGSSHPTLLVGCWRCGGEFPENTEACPRCGAVLASTAPVAIKPVGLSAFFPKVLIAFLAMMGVSLVCGLLQRGLEDITSILVLTSVAALVDAAIVLWVWCHRPAFKVYPPSSYRAWCWTLAWPMLIGLLLVNVNYHEMMKGLFAPPQEAPTEIETWQFAWMLALISLFPAVMEEMFFRRLVLDSFRDEAGSVGTAIWVSSIMFAMAHIGQPLGLPYLLVVGVFLGLLRVGTGSLALPMLAHGLHNGVVVWIEFSQHLAG